MFGFTWNKAFRRELIESNNIRYVVGLDMSEDEVFSLSCCLRAETFQLLDNPLYHYISKSNGLTFKRHRTEKFILLAKSLEQFIHLIINNGLKAHYHYWIWQLMLTVAEHSTLVRSMGYYKKAVVYGWRHGITHATRHVIATIVKRILKRM